MSIDASFQKQALQFKQRMKDAKSLIGLTKQLMESPHCESWKLMQILMTEADNRDALTKRECLQVLQRNIRDVRSFMMLMYLYWLKMSRRDLHLSHVYWKSLYIDIGMNNGEIIIFKTWVSSEPTSALIQQSLYLIARVFPPFFKEERVSLTEIQLGAIIEWVTYLQTPDPDKYSSACELVKMAKQTKLDVRQDYIQKEHFILKKLIEVSGQSAKSSANIFLFIYPFTLLEKDITYFCHIYCDFLTDLAEDNICNFFIALTKSAISKQIVFLINKMSQLLKNEDQFFKLRIIYQKFILPILARRAKSCNKVEEAVYQICSYFIMGFLKHCDIGDEGINCVLKGIDKIKNEKIKEKWVELCAIICHRYPQSKKIISESLKKQLGAGVELNSTAFKEILNDPEIVWEVTLRNGRQHKRYLKVPSKMRGIENKHNECYIISTVQGLQKTILLQDLLEGYRDKIKQKLGLLDEIRMLFGEIDGRRKAERITVSYLKKKGPSQFINSQHQEDAHQYIIQLFDAMEVEMKKVPKMFEQFKQIFQIKEINERICTKCKNVTKAEEFALTYTIPHTQILSESTEEQLPDYACQKCHAKDSCISKRTLAPECKILIVHINRFSHQNGKTKKQLSTQTILRNFGPYQLVGMICHIGKNVEHGHYIYYGKIGQKRWAQFNDKMVEQFDLGNQQQEFQRQMKAEMTPYILFYRKFD